MVESNNESIENMSTIDAFHHLEKTVADYNDYINCDPDHFKQTLKDFEYLVKRVQQESVFSKNETLKDISTEHMKILLLPCLEADVLYRLMDEREVRVRQSHVYYLEFLKLMKHYNLLEPQQIKKLKDFTQRYSDSLKGKETLDSKPTDPMAALMSGFEDRDTKIANYKLKKLLESNIDRLKDYKDEEAKREFYKSQIQLAIMSSLD